MHKIHAATVLTLKLDFYPDLNEPGEYRGNFQLCDRNEDQQVACLAEFVWDIYVTNPPAGRRQDDVLLTTGL